MSYTIHAGDSSIDATYVSSNFDVYNCLVDVIRDTKVNSSEGIALTPVALVSSMKCHIAWKKGRQKVLFNKDTHYMDAVIHCRKPVGVTIVNSDRIYYGGEYFEIVDIEDVNNLGTLLRIVIKKVK